MAFSGTVTQRVAAGGISVTTDNTLSGGWRGSIDEDVADSETDYEIVFTLDFSATKMFFLNSTQDVTFETNDGVAPDDTIALKANIPYVWYTNCYDTFKITADVTSIFITNASGSTATIRIEAIADPTP